MSAVIAERELGCVSLGSTVRGRVCFEALEPDDRCWHCVFVIDLPGTSVRRRVFGEDSFQALLLAMRSAISEIANCQAFKSGLLTIFDEPIQSIVDLKQAFGVTRIIGIDP